MPDRSNSERLYRNWVQTDNLVNYVVSEYETDLSISTEKNLALETLKAIKFYRKQLTDYIKLNPAFETSLTPIEASKNCPEIVIAMTIAAQKAGVGPFASIAGAMAEFTGKELLKYSQEVIIENGGDIFIASTTDKISGIYAGKSSFSGTLGIKIPASLMPCGVCSSSGTIGHSKSFGKADCVTILSKSTPLADAVATATANLIQTEEDINKAVDFAMNIEGVLGVIAIINKQIGVQGKIEFVKTS